MAGLLTHHFAPFDAHCTLCTPRFPLAFLYYWFPISCFPARISESHRQTRKSQSVDPVLVLVIVIDARTRLRAGARARWVAGASPRRFRGDPLHPRSVPNPCGSGWTCCGATLELGQENTDGCWACRQAVSGRLVGGVGRRRWLGPLGHGALRPVPRDVLLFRAGDPLPESLQYGGAVALCSLLFGAATLAALIGLIRLSRVAAFSSLALILLTASGAASAAGGAGLWLGASRELVWLRVASASEMGPKPEQVAAAIQFALGPTRVGYAGLLAGTTLLLVLSLGNLKQGVCAVTSRAGAGVAGGAGRGRGRGLLARAGGDLVSAARAGDQPRVGDVLKAGEVVRSILLALRISMLAAALLLVYGVLLIVFAILVRQATRQSKPVAHQNGAG